MFFLELVVSTLLLWLFRFRLRSSRSWSSPPMGWNSWNKFAHNVDEKFIRG